MKKIISALFSVIILMLCLIPAFSAAEVDLAGVAEPAVTEPGFIYFEVPSGGAVSWDDFKTVFCHISGKDSEIYAWQSDPEKCEDAGKGYWRYDVRSISFDPAGEYTVIFSNDKGDSTYALCFTSDCIGDIVYCEAYSESAPADDQKVVAIARWRNHKDTVHPAVDADSSDHTVSIDGVDPSKAQTVWGTGSGGSYELSEKPLSATSDEITEQDIIADESDGINLRAVTIAIVSVSVVLGGAIIALTVYLAKKNSGKK